MERVAAEEAERVADAQVKGVPSVAKRRLVLERRGAR